MGVARLWLGREETCCNLLPVAPLSLVPSQGFELWKCLPAKEGCEMVPEGSKEEKVNSRSR